VLHRKHPFGELDARVACLAAIAGERPPIKLEGERAAFVPLITQCWDHIPTRRPAMAQVVHELLRIEGCLAPSASRLAEPSFSATLDDAALAQHSHRAGRLEGAVLSTTPERLAALADSRMDWSSSPAMYEAASDMYEVASDNSCTAKVGNVSFVGVEPHSALASPIGGTDGSHSC